jgi:hypothetical protein
MAEFNQTDFIKKFYFTRQAGSDGEHRAAKIIAETIVSMGGDSSYEEFDINYFNIEKASLTVHSKGKDHSNEVTGYGRTGSTPINGITAPFVYAGTGSETELEGCEGKIVFVNAVHHDIYRRMIDKKIAGFITFDGSVSDDRTKTDLNTRSIKEKTAEFGSLPGITMRSADAVKMIKSNPGECDDRAETK